MSATACEPSPFENVGLLEPPRLADALSQVEDFLQSYIAFPTEAHSPAIALWVAHSHALAAFDYTPYLHVSSPEKQCGKSRVLDALRLLVPAPWLSVSPSEAVIYRKIASSVPTILLDEVDTIFTNGKDENKEGLRALLNAGFTRGATVPRCTGKEHKIVDFPVFCAKVIAGIGRVPDTVADRSIRILLARKTKFQVVERFRDREASKIARGIREALVAWARSELVLDDLRAARPLLPDALGDRQADICEPLFAIADAAGGDWPERARAALVELLTSAGGEGESVGVKLLAAIRRAFAQADATRLTTDQLLDALMLSDDGPWVGWWERDISAGNRRGAAVRMANLLKPYGISSASLRVDDDSTRKGYKIEHFLAAWECYLPSLQGYEAAPEAEHASELSQPGLFPQGT
jgi:hypothetical protein